MKKMSLLSVFSGVILSGLFLTSVPVLFATKGHGKRWVVDKIVARVNGVNILKSDLEKPQIGKEGGFYSLGEFIDEELLFQRAQEKQLLPSSTDIDRQIVSFKMQLNLNNATNEQFEEHLKEYGFTLDAYRKQLGRMLSVNNTKQAEISEKVLVTSQEVEDYYHHNPESVKATFNLHMAVLDEDKVDEYKTLVDSSQVTWKDLGFVEADEVDSRYVEATRMRVGEITAPIKVNTKYVLIKLEAKKDGHLLTLAERYGDIEKELQQEKRNSFVQLFQGELRSKAFIYFP